MNLEPLDDPHPPRPSLALTQEQRSELLAALHRAVRSDGCDHTLRATQLWATAQSVPWSRLRRALAAAGGYCDCEVLFTVFQAERDEPC